MNKVNEITIEKLIERYSVLLMDAYGVIVNKSGAISGAPQLISELNRKKKQYYILTNDASRLPQTMAERFDRFGLSIAIDKIISSGALLKDYFAQNQLVGARCVVLGPTDSARYVEIAGGKVVSPTEPFDVLVIGDERGYPFLEMVDRVLTGLFHKLDQGDTVRLVLPNPDLIYPKTDQEYGITSGSVALMFEAALLQRYPGRPPLRFERLGKPHAAIFQEALRRCSTRDMVMLGDQLETDILGANKFGIDSVLISNRITRKTLSEIPTNLHPTYRMHSIASGHGSKRSSS